MSDFYEMDTHICALCGRVLTYEIPPNPDNLCDKCLQLDDATFEKLKNELGGFEDE